jgi:hypothetical protein
MVRIRLRSAESKDFLAAGAVRAWQTADWRPFHREKPLRRKGFLYHHRSAVIEAHVLTSCSNSLPPRLQSIWTVSKRGCHPHTRSRYRTGGLFAVDQRRNYSNLSAARSLVSSEYVCVRPNLMISLPLIEEGSEL